MHKFSLIENAEDSLNFVVSHLIAAEDEAPGEWKRAISNLAHVVELLFKEKLRRAHPSFIFRNIDKYPSVGAATVGADLASQRVQKLCGVKFTNEDLLKITAIRIKRNEIEHYEFDIRSDEAKLLIGGILSFALKFSTEELGLDWREKHLSRDTWRKLIEYSEFHSTQLSYVIKKIEEDEIRTIECTACYNGTFDLDAEVCLLCGHKEDVARCSWCEQMFLPSSAESYESVLCNECEWQDGYAAANCERY